MFILKNAYTRGQLLDKYIGDTEKVYERRLRCWRTPSIWAYNRHCLCIIGGLIWRRELNDVPHSNTDGIHGLVHDRGANELDTINVGLRGPVFRLLDVRAQIEHFVDAAFLELLLPLGGNVGDLSRAEEDEGLHSGVGLEGRRIAVSIVAEVEYSLDVVERRVGEGLLGENGVKHDAGGKYGVIHVGREAEKAATVCR